MIFKPCRCGVFDEVSLSTFCRKMKKTCTDWRSCDAREPATVEYVEPPCGIQRIA